MRVLRVVVCVCAMAPVMGLKAAGSLDQWHSRTNYGSQYVRGVAYGAGTYVMVDASNGRIIAVKELAQAAPDALNVMVDWITGVAFGTNRFVVSSFAGIMTSTNGVNWERIRNVGAPPELQRVIYGNDRFVAIGKIGSKSGAMVSSNGLDWVSTNFPAGTSATMIAAGNGLFVTVGVGVCVSTDGLKWEAVPSPTPNGFYTVGFGDGMFVAVAIGSGDNVFTSTDGRNWTVRGRVDVVRPGQIAWGNGYFVTIGGGSRAYSRDAIQWTTVRSGTTEYDVSFIRGKFVAGGFGTLFESDPVVLMRMSQRLQLDLSGAPGDVYRIEETDSLGADSNWSFRQTVTLDGGRTETTVGIADVDAAARRFFRVVKIP